MTQNLDIHTCSTERKFDLHVQFWKTALFKKSVVNMGIKVYSKVLNTIKNLESFSVFKKRIKFFSTGTSLLYSN